MFSKIKIQNLCIAIGIIALGIMVYSIEIETIIENLKKTKWWIVPILSIWILVYILNTLSALLIINHIEELKKIGFIKLYKITLSTFAINTATPMGLIGGEPYKIIELSPYLGSNKATSSVILYSAMHFLAHFLFWMFAIIITLTTIPLNTFWNISLIILFVICTLLFYFTIKGCKRGFVNNILRIVNKIPFLTKIITKFIQKNRSNIQTIDIHIKELHSSSPKTFYGTLLIEWVARILSCAELYILFIAYQTNATFLDCILILAFTSLFANLLFFMPLQIGTREGGFIISMKLIGLSPSLAITISIITRIRELIWMLIGIILIKIK